MSDEPRTPPPVLELQASFAGPPEEVETCTVQFTFPVLEPFERAELDALWGQVREYLMRRLKMAAEDPKAVASPEFAAAVEDNPPTGEETRKAIALGADLVRILRRGKVALPYRVRELASTPIPPDWEAFEFVESGNRERPVILRVGRDGVRTWNPGRRA